ncbi:MAG: MMPL family transporter [Planctomycetia bacterium]|nr:MMPL family transporter [Planctomycetia bacterium]
MSHLKPDASSYQAPGRRVGSADSALFAVSIATLLALAACSPWIVRSAVEILGLDSTTPIEWVPETFPPRQAYGQFCREFESGDVVVASWPECTLGSPAIDRFIDAATGPSAPRSGDGEPWFESVVAGTTALERLTSAPLSLDRDAAIERLTGVLVGPDGKQTCLVIALTRAGLTDRRLATAWIRDTLLRTATTAADDLHLAGSVVDNVTVDEASAESLHVYGGPAALAIFLLTWWSLRSMRYALLVFLLALVCVGLCFVSLRICGDRMNPVLIVMPLLVLTLGVSGGIHLVNYLVEASQQGNDRGTAWRAIALGWLPCTLSAGTTALGLASLVVSELEPIRVFGFHSAIGVAATLAVLFLVVPGVFSRWPIRRGAGHHVESSASSAGFASGVVRAAGPIIFVAAVAMLAAVFGVPGIRTSVAIDTLFTPESRVIRDYRWLEGEIGPLAPVEVVLRFGADSDIRPAERLDITREVEAALREVPKVSGVLSAATFLPDLAPTSGSRGAARKAIVARKLESNLAGLTDMRIIRDTGSEQLWRVTARTSALAGIDYGDFLDAVRSRVAPIVAAHGGAAHGLAADCTGVMPLINAIQKTLLHDLFTSFLSACVVISLVMMVVERSVVAGLIAMIPNVFPMVLLFGLLGWTRLALDIGSVMTASVALGMAVDGTFHFLTFFRRGLSRDGGSSSDATEATATRVAAVHDAFRHSASALVQSAIVCGLGILAFAGSSFAPTRRFAWMLSLLVATALVGDLVVLPALLASRAGRWFVPRRPKQPR